MTKQLYIFLFLLTIVSCSKSNSEKAEVKNSQPIAKGDGTVLIVDTAQSVINWTGYKPSGHHFGTVKLKSGNIKLNGKDVAEGTFTIDMRTIVNEDLTDEKMNKMLIDHLKSHDFFDVERFRESRFIITNVEELSNDSTTHEISGNLLIKDREKNITFDAFITKEGNVFKAVSVPFSIDRTQWGIEYGSKNIFANLKDNFINDEIDLQITIVAYPAE